MHPAATGEIACTRAILPKIGLLQHNRLSATTQFFFLIKLWKQKKL